MRSDPLRSVVKGRATSAPLTPSARPLNLRRALIATLVGVGVAMLGVVVVATPVSAHTGFAGSDPANGAIVTEAVDEITIQFTGMSEETGDGFVVLDPSGQIREPTSVTTIDDQAFRLTFEPALGGGVSGVRWSVRAGDNHPIDGSFSFTVDTGGDDMSSMTPEEMAAMDDFLQVDQNSAGETTATIGRLLSIASIVLALGFLAFAATTLRGSRTEVEGLITAVRIVGAVMVVGAAVEYLGITRMEDQSLTSAWSSSAGGAIVLRALAGLGIAVGLSTSGPAPPEPTVDTRIAAALTRSAGAATFDDQRRSQEERVEPTCEPAGATRQWQPDRSSLLAYIGIGLAIASFWFDGHTVTEGFRPLHALASSVHVVAGSVWVGGVVALAVVLWLRRRYGRPTGALELVVRFSSVASVAVGAVIIAGLVMAVSILDSFGELTSTQWGQTLLVKSAAAGIAMLAGAYNHFRLMPALERNPDDGAIHNSVRSTVTAEAIMLLVVVVVTASLVAAAS